MSSISSEDSNNGKFVDDLGQIYIINEENPSCDRFFNKLCSEINIIGCDWSKQIITSNSERIVCINKLFMTSKPGCAKIEKQILVYPSCAIKLFVYDEEINPVELALSNSSITPEVKINSEFALQQFINWFNNVELCKGGPAFELELESHGKRGRGKEEKEINGAHKDDYLSVWRHNNCPLILPNKNQNQNKHCKLCKTIDVSMQRRRKKKEEKMEATSPTIKLNILRELRKDYMIKTNE